MMMKWSWVFVLFLSVSGIPVIPDPLYIVLHCSSINTFPPTHGSDIEFEFVFYISKHDNGAFVTTSAFNTTGPVQFLTDTQNFNKKVDYMIDYSSRLCVPRPVTNAEKAFDLLELNHFKPGPSIVSPQWGELQQYLLHLSLVQSGINITLTHHLSFDHTATLRQLAQTTTTRLGATGTVLSITKLQCSVPRYSSAANNPSNFVEPVQCPFKMTATNHSAPGVASTLVHSDAAFQHAIARHTVV
eukprot:TRINITY_DN112643_c0_g1_i1.p1 TRINITY_DN112643_c0_g1~~TRINITY_DN112643_c0_g1_i1.p1  ORF type:complete len:243 (+),score=31.06 TRINITY_DN112643_c0_g1_i1:26-754(+)